MEGLTRSRFLELINQYEDELRAYAARILWNADNVEDAFSDAVLVAWSKRDKFKPGTNFRAWIYRILTNKCYVANRHTMRSSVSVDDNFVPQTPEHYQTPEPFTDAEYRLENVNDVLYDALQSIRPVERESILLRAFENCSYKEIASRQGIPVGTVMTNLARGRAKLRERLPAQDLQEAAEVCYSAA